MSTFGDKKPIGIAGFDGLFACVAMIAIQLSHSGNLIAGISVVALFAQFRISLSERLILPGQDKWRKVFNLNLTRNDYLLIAMMFFVSQLIFAGQAIAADPVPEDAGKGLATGLDKAWTMLFEGDGAPSFFGVLANALRGIGIIALVAQGGFAMFKLFSSDGDLSAREFVKSLVIERLLPNALIIMMLANNGAGGAKVILTARALIFGWDKVAYTAMKEVSDSLKDKTLYEDERRALEEVRSLFNTCISMPPKIGGEDNPTFKQCIGEFQTKSLEVAASGRIKNQSTIEQLRKLHDNLNTASEGNVDDSFGRGIINAGTALSSLIGNASQSAANEFINGIIMSFGVAYNIMTEMALMLAGISLPLVLMLSLYKFDAFLKWLPQLLMIFTAKITYTIVGGMIQFIKADAGADLGTWGLAILMGIGSPLLSIFAALALNGTLGAVFEREAIRSGAAAARMAGRGVATVGGAVAGPVAGAVANAARTISRRV
jgi:hypothetical protein